ncbi:MAG TPA: hypothetical protein VJP85_00440 [Candidatus Baltobacteraceae bacterium]|nr:hypothetical protein [Candidatus Baltobacteraceae bacterium]
MQKLAALTIAISLLGPSALASAQTQPAPQSTTQAVPPSTVGTAGAPNFGQLISSLNNMRGEIAKVQAMNGGSANSLRPVNVSQLSGADPAALTTAVTKNQSQLNALRSTLGRVMVTTSTNERISIAQFLADNKIGLNQVVGADVNNGTLVIFFQK